MTRRERVAALATLAWAILILALTLRPAPTVLTTPGFCVVCGERGLADAILNVALFMPLGLGARRAGVGLVALSMAGLALSSGIEAVQFITPGRDMSAGDLMFNGIGMFLGGCIGPTLPKLLRPTDLLAVRLGLVWSVLFTLGTLGVAWLLEPDLPEAALELEDVPPAPRGGYLLGTLISRSVDGKQVPEGMLVSFGDDGDREHRLEVRFTAAEPRVAFRPVIGLKEPTGPRRPLLLGPKGEDWVLRLRRKADALHLTRTDLQLRRAIAQTARGDTLVGGFWRDGEAFCLRLAGAVRCGLGHTAGSGWALLIPDGWADGGRNRWLDAGWLALLMIPVGFWDRPGFASRLAVALALASATLIPLFSSLLAAPIFTLGGLLTGWSGGRLARAVFVGSP